MDALWDEAKDLEGEGRLSAAWIRAAEELGTSRVAGRRRRARARQRVGRPAPLPASASASCSWRRRGRGRPDRSRSRPGPRRAGADRRGPGRDQGAARRGLRRDDLKRDFGFRFRNLFDTMIAARFLGMPELGLQAVARAELGVELSKDSQRDDWSAGRSRPRSRSKACHAYVSSHRTGCRRRSSRRHKLARYSDGRDRQ